MTDLLTLPPGVPGDLQVVALLKHSAEHELFHVRRDGEDLVLRCSRSARPHVEQEIALARELRVTGLVAPIAWGRTSDGRAWLLRSYVEGKPLDQALRDASPAQSVIWVASLLTTLAALHDAGFVHRDLTAGNVLVGPSGVLLVDLDLLGRAGPELGGAGSRWHIAPEVLLGAAPDRRSDLFSLGVLLALTYAGEPAPEMLLHFPGRPFWQAARLDPGAVPALLAPLVEALLARHPADRPLDARAALALLDGEATEAGLEPSLPFLVGREATLRRLVSLAQGSPGEGAVILVVAEHAEERQPLLEQLRLELAIASAPATVERLDGTDVERVLELVLAPSGATQLLIVAPALVAAVDEALRVRQLDDLCPPAVVPWPDVTWRAVAQHLRRLTGDASPDLAESFATALHQRAQGRWSDLDHLLRRAVSEGVLRADRAGWALLSSSVPRWEADPRELRALGQDAWSLLQARAVLGEEGSSAEVRLVSRLPEARALGALAELRGAGVVRSAALDVADPRWLEAAERALTDELRQTAHLRCAELTTGARRLRHLAEAASSADEWRAVVEAALEDLDAGRTEAARRILGTLERRSAPAGLAHPLLELRGRLELLQGDARRALDGFLVALGPDLEGASLPLLRLGAHAAEQTGDRVLARRWWKRLQQQGGARADQLAALTGLAYAAFLDGDAAGALALAGEAPTADDPDGPAANLLNLRGVAAVRLRHFAQAERDLSAARERAQRAGQPLARARAELNQGFLDRRRGRPQAALAALRRAEEAFRAAGHVQGRALALHNEGVLLRDLGELAAARERLTQALPLRRRVADRHGALSTLGTLALVELDAGRLGLALPSLGRARAALAAGAYEPELAVIAGHEALALALSGRHVEAAELLARAGTAPAARIGGLVADAAGRADEARALLRQALGAAEAEEDAAEAFRAAGALLVLEPAAEEARVALLAAAEKLGSEVRRAEAAWRARTAVPGTAQLLELLRLFDGHGRTDLVRAIAAQLGQAQEDPAGLGARRTAQARAAEAADALTGGLPPEQREATLERLMRLAGADAMRSPPLRRGADLEWLLAAARRMAREEDVRGLLAASVEAALERTAARRGCLVLLSGDEVAVEVEVVRGAEQAGRSAEEARISLTLVRQCVAERAPLLTTDAATDARFSGQQSIASFALRSVLCVPLPLPDQAGVQGALYLDNDERAAVFDETDLQRVGWLADQAALALLALRRREQIEALNRRLVERVAFQEQELDAARRELRQKGRAAPVAGMVGESETMQAVFRLVERLAPTDLSVLVTGPSGTGKDLVARALHERSRRADKPFVVENVAALPANLLESELFGHVRGSFTGAERDRPGLFVEADGGTFFLDEIGEMSLDLQAKLLRVLESGELRPVGSRRSLKVDVRIVAATHRDLLRRVREGAFREDLYYRLNAAEIRLPPLEERLDDVPLLARHALEQLNVKHGTSKLLSDAVLAALVRRPWPGQVRELMNEVRRLYFLSEDVLADVGLVRAPAGDEAPAAEAMPASLTLDAAERAAIARALRASGGRKDKAAQLLDISRAGLYAKLKRFGLDDGAREPQ